MKQLVSRGRPGRSHNLLSYCVSGDDPSAARTNLQSAMTLYTGSGNLPHHQYVFVDCGYVRKETIGWEPAVWFGLRSEPGRAWGCHVMLECGAVYRDLPLHALAHTNDPEPWTLDQAQRWNCYSRQWSAVVYDFLADLPCVADVIGSKLPGRYVCTLVPIGDAYSLEPGQGKEHLLIALENGRFTIQPTNFVLFRDASFADKPAWPNDLKASDSVWRVDEGVFRPDWEAMLKVQEIGFAAMRAKGLSVETSAEEITAPNAKSPAQR